MTFRFLGTLFRDDIYIIRAKTENGYTRSVWSQKRVQPGIKSKIHPTSHAIGQKQIVPVFERKGRTYICKWLLCLVGCFQPFLFFFLLNHFADEYSVLYIVLHCCFGRHFLQFFCLFLLFQFFTTYEFHFTLFNHYAHLGTYVRTNHARITTTAVPSVDINSKGHKTGTHRDQVKNTRLPPQNSAGALAPWSYPDLIPPGLDSSKLKLDTSKYIISRRQVYLWVIVPQKRAT